jgi:hypothetical protein
MVGWLPALGLAPAGIASCGSNLRDVIPFALMIVRERRIPVLLSDVCGYAEAKV